MKRQKIRKALNLISFLLLPITLCYLSPYLIIQGASEGIITGSFIVFTLMFIVSAFLGRAFCGWACPVGGLQECCVLVTNKKAKGGRLGWIKYSIWIPWIIAIMIMFKAAGGFKYMDFYYQTDHGISVTSPQAYVIFYGVILLVVVLAFTVGRRSFCHYVCWMAPFMIISTKLTTVLQYSVLHLEVQEDKCISCNACTEKCPMSLPVMDMVHKGAMSKSECILCGECVDGCPEKVIRYLRQGPLSTIIHEMDNL